MESDTIEVEWLEEEPESKKTELSGKTESGQKKIPEEPEFTQVREGGRTYLLCACGEAFDDEEAMLACNRPEGLLPVAKKSVNGQMMLSYDITGKQSLSGCYGKKAIAYRELCTVLLSVDGCLNRMEEYLLSVDSLILCPLYLYTNMTGKHLYFAYLPTLSGSFSEHIKELAHFLMEQVDYQDKRAVALAGQFYQYAEAENFCMTIFLEENRAYFEETDMKKEQDERAVNPPPEEWQIQEDGGFPQMTGEEQDRGKKSVLIGLTVAAAVGFAAKLLSWNAITLIPAGVCAEIAVGISIWYIGRAKRTLIKKEREIFFVDDYSLSGGAPSAADAGVGSKESALSSD